MRAGLYGNGFLTSATMIAPFGPKLSLSGTGGNLLTARALW